MTTRTGTVAPSNSTDAYFRLWGKWISDCFPAFSWSQASDTGQINWATVATPPAINTYQGYEIWKMDDTLQATVPVYLKIEYGSGGTATWPSIAITIGTGSDGAGNLTGVIHPRSTHSSGGTTTTVQDCYASGSTNRVAVALARAVNGAIIFTLERTHDATGADTNVGVMFLASYASTVKYSKQSNFSGSNPSAYAQICVTPTPPSGSGALSPDIHCYPCRCWTPGESFPSFNMVAACAPDFAQGSTYSITGYDGTSRTYVALGGSYAGTLGSVNQSTMALLRYD